MRAVQELGMEGMEKHCWKGIGFSVGLGGCGVKAQLVTGFMVVLAVKSVMFGDEELVFQRQGWSRGAVRNSPRLTASDGSKLNPLGISAG